MSEAGPIIFWVFVLIAVYVGTRRINAWRATRACAALIEELESRGAYDPASAVALKDAKRDLLRAGLRNFRPEGLKMLLAGEVVGVTPEEKYYLNRRPGSTP